MLFRTEFGSAHVTFGVGSVQVGDVSTTSPGAVSAKPCGVTAYDFSRHAGSNKRSYRRVLGITVQEAAWFCPPKLVQVKRTHHDRRRVLCRYRGLKLRVCSLNLGGVCTAPYYCLCNWLESCSYDMVLLQETHHGMGKEAPQWQTKSWHCIASAHPAIQLSGVAALVRKSIAREDCVRFQELVRGRRRLLHVRIFPSAMKEEPGCSIDILRIYQFAGGDERILQGGRQKVWTT